MERIFKFKAMSLDGRDNTVVVECLNEGATAASVLENAEEAKALAQQLAAWLTPASTNAMVSEFTKMGYTG